MVSLHRSVKRTINNMENMKTTHPNKNRQKHTDNARHKTKYKKTHTIVYKTQHRKPKNGHYEPYQIWE